MKDRTPRILVIDDDPLFQSLMVSLLRKDYEVQVASEGSEGYELALKTNPDVAVIDVQMPGWDGLKTLLAFQEHPQLATIPVMMLTSDASKETVVTAIGGGATDYVIKSSFSKDEFRSKLDHLLEIALGGQASSSDSHSPAEQGQSAGESAASEEETRALQEIMDAWE